MQRLASRAGRRICSSLACSAYPPEAAETASGCTHCCFGVTHAMRSGHQRSRAENVPEARGSLKDKEKQICEFRVEDGDRLWATVDNRGKTIKAAILSTRFAPYQLTLRKTSGCSRTT